MLLGQCEVPPNAEGCSSGCFVGLGIGFLLDVVHTLFSRHEYQSDT